jgi:hypothetical protein
MTGPLQLSFLKCPSIVPNHVHWYRKDDGGVLLCRDGVESLQISQLHGHGTAGYHFGCSFQCTTSLFAPSAAITCNTKSENATPDPTHPGSRLPYSLCLCRHGSLKLHWQPHIYAGMYNVIIMPIPFTKPTSQLSPP